MMPVMDGIEALKKMRGEGNTSPILLLTAKSEVRDRIHGLDAGADDYLTKPFAMGELTARIRSLTRRSGVYSGGSLKIGPVELNIRQNLLTCVNSITLSQAETELLALFMREYGKLLLPEEIVNRVWRNTPDAGRDTLKLYVLYLNGKLDSVGARLRVKETEAGFLLRGLDA
ncbi:MAG: response regulator transcription factor, partial [Clostridia bacterium]|nr:response regulator transcription factor [Clostridia bacterium]